MVSEEWRLQFCIVHGLTVANVRNTLMVSRLGGPHNLASCSMRARKAMHKRGLWSVVCHYCCYLCIKDWCIPYSQSAPSIGKNGRYSLTDKNELEVLVIGLGTQHNVEHLWQHAMLGLFMFNNITFIYLITVHVRSNQNESFHSYLEHSNYLQTCLRF